MGDIFSPSPPDPPEPEPPPPPEPVLAEDATQQAATRDEGRRRRAKRRKSSVQGLTLVTKGGASSRPLVSGPGTLISGT